MIKPSELWEVIKEWGKGQLVNFDKSTISAIIKCLKRNVIGMVNVGTIQGGSLNRTKLDSYAVSIVVGRNVLDTHDSGKSVNVWPFMEQLGKLKDIPIVDCVVARNFPYSKRTFLLALYNAFYITKMRENLVPPFKLCRQGNVVNEITKIQIDAH